MTLRRSARQPHPQGSVISLSRRHSTPLSLGTGSCRLTTGSGGRWFFDPLLASRCAESRKTCAANAIDRRPALAENTTPRTTKPLRSRSQSNGGLRSLGRCPPVLGLVSLVCPTGPAHQAATRQYQHTACTHRTPGEAGATGGTRLRNRPCAWCHAVPRTDGQCPSSKPRRPGSPLSSGGSSVMALVTHSKFAFSLVASA